MPVPVREKSFKDHKYSLLLRGVDVSVYAYAPVVWVSVTRPDVATFPADAPKFPALVDTGNTARFLIRQDHFQAWTNLRPDDLPLDPRKAVVSDASGRKTSPARRQAKIWLHPYPDGPAVDLNADGGILIHESPDPDKPSTVGPFLPLLGATCLYPLGLAIFVDYERLTFSIGDDLRVY